MKDLRQRENRKYSILHVFLRKGLFAKRQTPILRISPDSNSTFLYINVHFNTAYNTAYNVY